MPGVPPPNRDLADLAALLGNDNVRQLVRTFLREYPILIGQLASGDRKTQHRIAHSLKSNARVIGAHSLFAHMAQIEERLSRADGPDLAPAEVAAVRTLFDDAADKLRDFAAET